MRYTASAVVKNDRVWSPLDVEFASGDDITPFMLLLALRRFSLLGTRTAVGAPKLPVRLCPFVGASPADNATDVTDFVMACALLLPVAAAGEDSGFSGALMTSSSQL